jgi:integrase
MPRILRKPSYLLHNATGQARVRIGGRDHYLGPYGSVESRAVYDALVDDWLGAKSASRATLTIAQLSLQYLKFAADYYSRPGDGLADQACTDAKKRVTSEVSCIRAALRPLVAMYGPQPAAAFGPLRLKKVREAMIARGWSRKTINKQVHRIQRVFRWAVSDELLPETVHRALLTVAGLAQGRSDAAESEPVKPVAAAFVEAVQPHVSRHVWAMIQLQRLTGARPGEIVSMRIGDLNTSGQIIWEYTPRTHKSQHRGRGRFIPIGPKAQAVLQPFLRPNVEAFVFSPVEADAERQAKRKADRKSPRNRWQEARLPRANGKRRPNERYTVASYRRAIKRACTAAGVPAWHPHQLRHNAATELRRAYGVEAARILLGHATLDATEIYAEADVQRARQIALEVG